MYTRARIGRVVEQRIIHRTLTAQQLLEIHRNRRTAVVVHSCRLRGRSRAVPLDFRLDGARGDGLSDDRRVRFATPAPAAPRDDAPVALLDVLGELQDALLDQHLEPLDGPPVEAAEQQIDLDDVVGPFQAPLVEGRALPPRTLGGQTGVRRGEDRLLEGERVRYAQPRHRSGLATYGQSLVVFLPPVDVRPDGAFGPDEAKDRCAYVQGV